MANWRTRPAKVREVETYNIRGDLPSVVPYIVGGRPAEPNAFSWQVDLGDCGGTLIARDWVLTAAHCVGDGKPASVRVGSYELGGGQEIEVSAIHIHPEYSDSIDIYDIALLHLATAAPEALGVVALPDLATHNRLAAIGKTVTAIGWGQTESGSRPTHLQQADLLLDACAQDYSYSVCTATLRFSTEATNTCFGDSGGPLLGRDGGTYYQIGITSRSPGLDAGASVCYDGTIFEKVASHLDWISSVTGIAFVEPPPAPQDPMVVDICSRTPRVVDEILSIAGVTDCATVTDADLAAITHMNLSNEGLSALQEGDFAGLSGLAFLDLRDNGLTQLPQSLFADLTALTELVLDGNWLGTLPADVFDPLAALTLLDLAENSLMELSEEVFDNLSSLITLNISRNRIAALPTGTFDNLSRLQKLNLAENSVAELPAGIFDGLSSLAWLNLEGNPIAALPEGIFANLPGLATLFLGGSTESLTLTAGVFDGLEGLRWLKMRGVASLPADAFAGTPHLRRLNITDGTLSSLPAGVFDNLSSLIELNLLGNPIAALPEGIFTDLTELKILFLGASTGSLTVTAGMFDGLEGLRWLRLLGVESLPDDVFAGTPNLHTLDVSNGALSSLPAGMFDNLNGLIELNLEGNPIAAVPEGIFANLTELEILSLGDSRDLLSLLFGGLEGLVPEVADDVETLVPLTLTAGVFDGLEGLEDLTLHSVESLTADIFAGTPSLIVLQIYDGTFSSLPAGVFDSLSSLQALTIDRCGITALPSGIFEELGSLTTLNLEENEITALPSGIFDELGSLTGLNLTGNPLTGLPEGIFANLTGLVLLNLGERMGSLTLTAGVFDSLNGLQLLVLHGVAALPADVFAATPNLEILAVSDGALSSLPSGVFERLTYLRFLHLHNNELTTLPAGVFAGLSNLQFLYLQENPGAPFILTPTLQPVGSGHQDGTVKLRVFVAEGAPFETGVGWTATGEVIGPATGRVSVPAGSLYSEPFKLTGADSRGRISIALSDPTFLGSPEYSREALGLAAGDPLTLDLATLPSFGQQFVVDEDIPEMPTGVWSPDLLSRASFSQVGGQTAITFSHGGRVEEEGVAYTCMSSGGCEIEDTRVAKGIILRLQAGGPSRVAGRRRGPIRR